jgi:hypothetical protein
MNSIWIYDIETYPNIFSAGFKNPETGEKCLFEISWRKNQIMEFMSFLSSLRLENCYMCGFNNVGFDYPVIHFIIENQDKINVLDIYYKAMAIINAPWNNRFAHVIWDNDQHVKQLDLFKIHHFDNVSKKTSLKVLEFNMRMDFIEDLPYKPGSLLDWQECNNLVKYMWNDIEATELFFNESKTQIKFREELTQKYGINFMNANDTKIGKDYIKMALEKAAPGSCYDKSSGKRKPRQTPREYIHVRDILFPYIQFTHPEFQEIHRWFQQQTITNTKGEFDDVSCVVRGFQFDFGTGGIHGSVSPRIVSAGGGYGILDIDVASYYPNLGIKNKLHPEHLGKKFCEVYEDIYKQRKLYEKGTAENLMLKLALNGTYGDSNNKYSVFYDPQYTMSITINGQLLLCMLAEALMAHDQIEMLQINTDGLTIKHPFGLESWIKKVCFWWENLTQLELEYNNYNKIFIRDCNNYIAEKTDGSLKRKGAYCHETPRENPNTQEVPWHKNHSALVVPKAAEAALVRGEDIKTFIENHKDIYDFMLRTKVSRTNNLVMVDYEKKDIPLQRVSRYYISMMGYDLIKLIPPTTTQLAAGKTEMRRIGIHADWKATPCNDIKQCNPDDIEFEYYIQEAKKLVDPLRR